MLPGKTGDGAVAQDVLDDSDVVDEALRYCRGIGSCSLSKMRSLVVSDWLEVKNVSV